MRWFLAGMPLPYLTSSAASSVFSFLPNVYPRKLMDLPIIFSAFACVSAAGCASLAADAAFMALTPFIFAALSLSPWAIMALPGPPTPRLTTAEGFFSLYWSMAILTLMMRLAVSGRPEPSNLFVFIAALTEAGILDSPPNMSATAL